MKYLILLLISFNSFACQLSIPESYIPTFLNPPVVGHYEKCEDKPQEKCHCVESVNSFYAELVDNVVLDYVRKDNVVTCLDDVDCETKHQAHSCTEGRLIKNLDTLEVYCAVDVMKVEGKKLVESPVKKAAYEAVKLAEKEAKELEVQKREQAKSKLRNLDFTELESATTILQLRNALKKILPDIVEASK